MGRYYFHLHERGTVLEDLEGRDCASLDRARQLAIENARDLMIGEMREGRLSLDCFISIVNAASEEVGKVYFHEAVSVSGAK